MNETTEAAREGADAEATTAGPQAREPVALGVVLQRGWKSLLVAEAALLALAMAAFFTGGIASDLAIAGVEVVPIIMVTHLAMVAEGRRWARTASSWLLGSMIVVGWLGSVFLAMSIAGEAEGSAVAPDTAARVAMLVLGLGTLGTVVALETPAKRWLPRVAPIDPHDRLHRTGLWLAVMAALFLLAPLIATGEPWLLAMSERAWVDVSDVDQGALQQLFGLVWLIPAAFLCAGWHVKRTTRETLERLGLTGWTWRQIVVAAVAGLALALVSGLMLDPLVQSIWDLLGWRTTDPASVAKMFPAALAPVGILAISASAGVGEELAVRGLLQPRLGVWPASVFFTALHAPQYRWDGLLCVFVLSLCFGLARKRWNTVVCIATHMFYDIGAFGFSIG